MHSLYTVIDSNGARTIRQFAPVEATNFTANTSGYHMNVQHTNLYTTQEYIMIGYYALKLPCT